MKLGIEAPPVQSSDLATHQERRLLLERIAGSKTFHRSPRLREVLFDIVEKTLAGQTRELTEQLIGVRVFGRDPSYNPADDTIVRSSARQLRHKLAEYFAAEGHFETLLLEIPKGAYVAAFLPRPLLDEPESTLVECLPLQTAPARRGLLIWDRKRIACLGGALRYRLLDRPARFPRASRRRAGYALLPAVPGTSGSRTPGGYGLGGRNS